MKERQYRVGKKRITIDIPSELYDMFAKICIDYSITKTEGFVRYLEYLKNKHYATRKLLDENTIDNFGLDD